MAIDLLAGSSQPIDLLAPQQQPQGMQQSFYDLSPQDQGQVMTLAKKKIAEQHPNMPEWMVDLFLKMTPKDQSPMLESAARGVSAVTDYIPAAAGGLLQGASLPIRGIASTIPTEFTQKLANSRDLRDLFPKPSTAGQKAVQDTGEFFGALGPYGKLFSALKGATQAARIPKVLQNATALAGTGYLGTPGETTDKIIGAGGALALGGAGKAIGKTGEVLPKFIRGVFSDANPESIIEAVQKPHDILQRSANELYGQVKSAIGQRGVKTPISEGLIEQAAEHFPKNARSYKDLLARAKAGDYEAVHDIQSSLYKKGTKALSSDDLAVENQGEDILDLRDKINEELNNHLIKEGHLDIAHVLSQGKKLYSDLQKTYYNKLLPKGIPKLVQSETRLIPENIQNLFKQNSVPMKAFLERHPEAAKQLKALAEKEKARETLSSIATKGGVAGGLGFGTKTIWDLLFK